MSGTNTQMHQEWEAWQEVVKHWPGDINKDNPKLARAIMLWGERLATLRRDQPLEVCERALQTAVNNYARVTA